jgi:type II secretory pathway component PulF
MIFNYKAVDANGAEREGVIEAGTSDIALSSLQRRGLIVSSIKSVEESNSILQKQFHLFQRVTNKEVVILSRQIAVLFEAQVSALRVFRLIASEILNPLLRTALLTVADDIQAGNSISKAMQRHPNIFSNFYVSMVRSGEESGKLDKTFLYLADYLDRTYAITTKARNALIYPAFVVITFIGVMAIMFTVIIPKIQGIITESGVQIPIYTKIILGVSSVAVNYGIFVLIILLAAIVAGGWYVRTPEGKRAFDEFKLSVPYVGDLYKKLYLSRIADNMNTMLVSGITMIKALEITASVIGNQIYEEVLNDILEAVKGGASLSESFSHHKEIPGIMVQMVKVGEETGELGGILETMSKFYEREVTTAVDTLVGLIEPVMIIVLGVGVGFLLAAILVPIYNIAGSF